MAHNTYPFYYSPQKLDAHEDLAEYCQFGAHPVVLGQILPEPETCVSDKEKQPQYRIIAKLGHGAFSTVWLARDLEQSFVLPFLPNGMGADLLVASM
jgi:serine/threonine protein kinase